MVQWFTREMCQRDMRIAETAIVIFITYETHNNNNNNNNNETIPK